MKQVAALLVLWIVVLFCLPWVPMPSQPTAVSWEPGVLFTAVALMPLALRRKGGGGEL